MTSNDIGDKCITNEKRTLSISSDDELEPLRKKPCKNGEKVKKDLSEIMDSIAESNNMLLVLHDCVKEETPDVSNNVTSNVEEGNTEDSCNQEKDFSFKKDDSDSDQILLAKFGRFDDASSGESNNDQKSDRGQKKRVNKQSLSPDSESDVPVQEDVESEDDKPLKSVDTGSGKRSERKKESITKSKMECKKLDGKKMEVVTECPSSDSEDDSPLKPVDKKYVCSGETISKEKQEWLKKQLKPRKSKSKKSVEVCDRKKKNAEKDKSSSDSDEPLNPKCKKSIAVSQKEEENVDRDNLSDSDEPLKPKSKKCIEVSKKEKKNLDKDNFSSDSDVPLKSPALTSIQSLSVKEKESLSSNRSRKKSGSRAKNKRVGNSLEKSAAFDSGSGSDEEFKTTSGKNPTVRGSNSDAELESSKDSVPKPKRERVCDSFIRDSVSEKNSSDSKRKVKSDASTSDSGSDPDLDSKDESKKSAGDNSSKDKANDSTSDSGPDADLDSENDSIKKNDKMKAKSDKGDCSSDSDSDLDSEPDSDSMKRNDNLKSDKENNPVKVSKGQKTGKNEIDTTDPNQNPTIIRLKKYINTAGIIVKYVKLWEGCENNKARAKKMMSVLENAGINGRPTLEKCRKLKKKREFDREMDALKENVIINQNGRALRMRGKPMGDPQPEMKKAFQRMRAVFDSDSE